MEKRANTGKRGSQRKTEKTERKTDTETDEEKENKLTEMCVPNQWMY